MLNSWKDTLMSLHDLDKWIYLVNDQRIIFAKFV